MASSTRRAPSRLAIAATIAILVLVWAEFHRCENRASLFAAVCDGFFPGGAGGSVHDSGVLLLPQVEGVCGGGRASPPRVGAARFLDFPLFGVLRGMCESDVLHDWFVFHPGQPCCGDCRTGANLHPYTGGPFSS